MKKILLTTILLGTMVLSSVGVSASTSEGNNKWAYNKDLKGYTYQLNGAYAHDGIAQINNRMYYFDSNGVMTKGWIQTDRGYMYADGTGVLQTGWKYINSNWYFFNNSHEMLTGTIVLQNGTYNLASDGHLL